MYQNSEAMVIDHQNFVAPEEDISHTLIRGGELINSKTILGPQKNKVGAGGGVRYGNL